jgi:uncharacterized cupredoxin-like copper-binding protein
MMTKSRRTPAAILLASALLVLAGATTLRAHYDQHFSTGEPGNPKEPFRIVQVTMREGNGTMTYEPATLDFKQGEQIKFVITNSGALAHEFVLGNTADNLEHAALMRKYPDMKHDDPNAKTIQPGASAEILWHFTKRGTFEFACLIPGHREAGMLGSITVK